VPRLGGLKHLVPQQSDIMCLCTLCMLVNRKNLCVYDGQTGYIVSAFAVLPFCSFFKVGCMVCRVMRKPFTVKKIPRLVFLAFFIILFFKSHHTHHTPVQEYIIFKTQPVYFASGWIFNNRLQSPPFNPADALSGHCNQIHMLLMPAPKV
jgi:hypothetical protein